MTMKKLAIIILAVISATLAGCSSRQKDGRLSDQQYFDWFLSTLPEKEKEAYSPEFWAGNVLAAIRVRNAVDRNIPEYIFRHFVLPVRVYTEPLDDFRMTYADSLCALVKDLDLEQATLKINHWCLANATYGFHAGGFDSPRGTMERGIGACEELSVFTASALRAAGIPARLVSTRWTHVDGLHAWVEAWTGDGWKFLGSCEPSPRLNESWVRVHAPKCAQITCIVAGDYDGPEPVVDKNDFSTTVNVVGNYAPVREITVTVRDALGKCVKGANVEFKTYSGGMLYTAQSGVTDSKGRIKAAFGTADMAIWACKGDNYCLQKLSSDQETVVLTESLDKQARIDFDLSPADQPEIPELSTEDERELCGKQIGIDDAIRTARHSGPARDYLIEYFKTKYSVPVKIDPVKKDSPELSFRLHKNGVEGHVSVSSIRDGKTVPSFRKRIYRGPVLIVTGVRKEDGTALVRADILPVPDDGGTVDLYASFRSVDAE